MILQNRLEGSPLAVEIKGRDILFIRIFRVCADVP
jgi:hypothetical protein